MLTCNPNTRIKVYVIEDWSWAHVSIDRTTHIQGFYPKQKPLTILIFEILLACGSTPGLIGQVIVNENSAWITRGPREIDPLSFKISKQFHQRGRDLISALD